MMIRLLILCSCLLSLHSHATVSGAHSSRALEALQRTTSLQHTRLDDGSELRWLDEEGQIPLGIFLQDQTGEATGVALLLPDNHSSPLNQQLLDPVRRHLAAQGWDTLTLAMPVEDAPALPERTLPVLSRLKPAPAEGEQAQETSEGTAESDEEAAPEEETQPSSEEEADNAQEMVTGDEENAGDAATTPKPVKPRPREAFTPLPEPASYAQQMEQRLDTALQQLRQLRTQPDEVNLVIGFGKSAADAAHVGLIFQKRLGTIEHGIKNLGIAFIEPEPVSPSGRVLDEQIRQLRAPTIDLYFAKPGQARLTSDHVQRRNLAKRSGHKAYHSTRIRSWQGNWRERSRWLVKTLQGQLQRYVLDRQTVPERVKESQKAFEAAPGARL